MFVLDGSVIHFTTLIDSRCFRLFLLKYALITGGMSKSPSDIKVGYLFRGKMKFLVFKNFLRPLSWSLFEPPIFIFH